MYCVIFNQHSLCISLFLLLYTIKHLDGCTIPAVLQNANWDYDFDSTTATLHFTSSGMTGLPFTARGEVLNSYYCIANKDDVYVFKSSQSYSHRGDDRWIYLCMKMTKVSENLHYFYLLADRSTVVSSNDRVISPAVVLSDNSPLCATFCSYTTPIPDNDARPLRRVGTSESLPGGETLCGTCASPCASPGMSNTTKSNTSNTNNDGCTIPAILQSANWDYDFDSTTALLHFTSSGMTGLPFTARGEVLNTYNCIANKDDVYVFKSSNSYSHRGEDRWIYLCMKMTKVSDNLYYFYLLADHYADVTPNDRVLNPPAGTLLSDNSPLCATFCSYTTPIPDNDARPLRREGTSEPLPGGETLCGTCASPCASPGNTNTTNNNTSNTDGDGCTIPAVLQNANWDYDFDSTTALLHFTSSGMTGLPFTARGEVLNSYYCIANKDDVYVFKSSQSYSDRGEDRWIYLCMKMTKVSDNLHYFYLLADHYADVTPNDRVLNPPAGTLLSDNSPLCATFCSYTTPIPDNDARPLRKEGTSEPLPGGETLCGTCASPCASPGNTNTTNNNTSNTDDDGCTIPAVLQNANWDYDFDSTTAILHFTSSGMTGLPFTARGEVLNSYYCIANKDDVYVFKSSQSYSDRGEDRWIYLCMKMTKVSDNLHYFYLLADHYADVTPNDRVLNPPAGTLLSDNSPLCATFCSYTTPIPDNDARPLRKEGTSEPLPGGDTLCGTCASPCASPGNTNTTNNNTSNTDDDGCTIPAVLQNANWDYDFDSTTAILHFTSSGMTGLPFTARGEVLNSYYCIANKDDVYVFKSSQSYSDRGEDRWIYLCMKMTKVSDNLHYFYLLADHYADVTPNDRVLNPPAGTLLSDNSPLCATFCSYTTPIPDNDARPLRKEGTSEPLPGGETLCGTCASPCASPGNTNTTNNNTSNTDDDGCTIPAVLQNANWDYDFDSTTAILHFTSSGMTGLPFTARGEVLNSYYCIANKDDVYVFKSSQSYSDRGEDRWIYLCMKMTKVSDNLHYFYLLADRYADVTPNDRVFNPPAGTLLSDNSPLCATFCSYTTPIPDNDARPLRREGTSESLPGGETLCGSCASPCASPGKSNTTKSNTSNTNDVGCTIPAILQSANWDYDFDSTTATLHFTSSGMTGLSFTAKGEVLNTYDCIANKDDVYVFKSSKSYTHRRHDKWIYLCMKMTKVSENLHYFYLLADRYADVIPNDRVLSPPACTVLSDNSPLCATFCSYTTPIPDNDARPLRREGTSEPLPGGETLCGTCASPCASPGKTNTTNDNTSNINDG